MDDEQNGRSFALLALQSTAEECDTAPVLLELSLEMQQNQGVRDSIRVSLSSHQQTCLLGLGIRTLTLTPTELVQNKSKDALVIAAARVVGVCMEFLSVTTELVHARRSRCKTQFTGDFLLLPEGTTHDVKDSVLVDAIFATAASTTAFLRERCCQADVAITASTSQA